MTQTAEDGLAVYYCDTDAGGCGAFQSTCDLPRLTFKQVSDGVYGIDGRQLVIVDPDVGSPSGQVFAGVTDVPEDTRLSATLRRDTQLPFGNYDGTIEVTFSGDTFTIHTMVDPMLPQQ